MCMPERFELLIFLEGSGEIHWGGEHGQVWTGASLVASGGAGNI